ncbi:MAG TPA: hypothetical protein H9880_03525 [Candidatus Anaerobutyricum avicola]|nr:hypothetical protein [Candidatus Anaerobutyricum avicola]
MRSSHNGRRAQAVYPIALSWLSDCKGRENVMDEVLSRSPTTRADMPKAYGQLLVRSTGIA